MTGSVNGYTTNFKFKKINFNVAPWHDLEWSNWAAVDALLYTYLSISNVQGVWQNSTAYTAGQRVIDDVNGRIMQCGVDNTSSAAPTTFAQEQIAHPTYWTNIGILPRMRGDWATGTLYSSNDYVKNGYQFAVCIQDHTAGVDFAADVVAGYWTVLCDLTSAINTAAGSASAAAVSALAAATSETNAAASETNALSYKNAAATSATNAATSESNALTYKNAADASASNAATHETNALASKNAAATSASNAATSETNALASKIAAQTAATNAAASAASINAVPIAGNAGRFLRVKDDETGLEYSDVVAGFNAFLLMGA